MIEVNFICIQAGSDHITSAVFQHECSMGINFDFILGKKQMQMCKCFVLAFSFLKVCPSVDLINFVMFGFSFEKIKAE